MQGGLRRSEDDVDVSASVAMPGPLLQIYRRDFGSEETLEAISGRSPVEPYAAAVSDLPVTAPGDLASGADADPL